MKKKLLLAACLCMIGIMGLATGCSDKETEEKAASTEKKEEELKVIGTESEDAFKVELKNSTGKDITAISVKLTETAEYPATMLAAGDVFADEESRILYYKAEEATADTANAEDANAKVLTQGYDIQLTFEDSSTAELHSFPFEDIEKGEICFADEVAYVSYTSVSTEQKVETKEAELTIKADQEAAEKKAAEEAAAQAAAEQKAAEEAAAQAAAEQAAAEAAAAQAAQESYYQDNYYDSGYSDGGYTQDYVEPAAPAETTGGDDACLDGALTY